jgi:predicted transposase
MEQMTITAKIQIVVDETDKVLLDETMSVYRNACNYVSDYVFRTHDLKQFSLNKVLYSTLRENFNLKSQMAQSVLKTVIARYKTILENQNEWMKPSFKKPQYDLVWNRDYSLTQNCFSINTLNGRVKLSYFADGMSMMIIYIAGIQNIPGDLIEAAKIDGATSGQILKNVTIPMVMPSITICTFLTLTNSFKLFDQNLALTNGEPSNMSELLALNIFRTFYGRTGWEGVGQAKAVVFFLLVAAIALTQNWLTRRKEVQQ